MPSTDPHTHLDSLEYVPEHRPLLPLVSLGSVLVTVRGQRVQFVAQLVPVVKLKLLKTHGETCYFHHRRKRPDRLLNAARQSR